MMWLEKLKNFLGMKHDYYALCSDEDLERFKDEGLNNDEILEEQLLSLKFEMWEFSRLK